jgi:hypothetical protein
MPIPSKKRAAPKNVSDVRNKTSSEKKIPIKTSNQKKPIVATTSSSVVSANTSIIGDFESQRASEMTPLIKKAAKIASDFSAITKKIAAFETGILYKYLSQTYSLYEEIKKDKHHHTYFEHLRYYLKDKGIRTTKDTSEISLLIRLIFVVKPKTAHLYSRAIEAAVGAKVKPAAFIGYVEKNGGLEKLRLSQVENDKSKIQREALKKAHKLAWRYLKAREIRPLATTNVPAANLFPTQNNFVVLVGAGYKDGTVNILSGLPNDKDIEEFILTSLAKGFMSNIAAAEKFVIGLEKGELLEKQNTRRHR